jgi:hypothetical protein
VNKLDDETALLSKEELIALQVIKDAKFAMNEMLILNAKSSLTK